MARDKVELLVEIIGKDGITKLLDTAATEALKLERNLKKGSKRGNMLAKSVQQVGSSWAEVVTGLNQGLELFSKLASGAQAVADVVKETARVRQIEAQFVEKLNVSVQALSQASGFQLSSTELKQFALQAQRAGVSMQQFQQLLNLSLRASAASGLEFEQVFEGLFLDTVIGASDSFLEQLGIVADLGTITEKYAASQGIAKDAIDKTHQSQAILNHLLGDVNNRFKDVSVDPFVQELGRAQQAVNDFRRDANTALTLAANDFMKWATGRKTDVKTAFQDFRDAELTLARVRKNFAENERRMEGNGFAAISASMAKMGRAARENEDAMRLLFDRIEADARKLSEVAGAFGTAEQRSALYDKALKDLAKQYGVLDVAEQQFTDRAKEVNRTLRAQKTVADSTREAFEALEKTLSTAPDPDALPGKMKPDEDDKRTRAFVEQEKLNQKQRKKANRARLAQMRRAAAALKREQERQRKEQERQLKKDMETVRKGLAERLKLDRETLAFETDVMTDFATAFNDPFFTERIPLIDQLQNLSEAMRDVGAAATSMDEAIKALGGSPGFTNAAEQGGRMAASILKFSDANEKTAGTYGELTSGIVTASGEAALGFIENEKARAAISAVMETANAGAMFAKFAATGAPNFAVAGSMHLVNAGMYAAIAGGAGGGGSAGRAGGSAGRREPTGMRDIPTFGQQQSRQEMKSANVVVNMSGAIVAGANRRKTANDLGDLVQESMGARR